MDSETKLKIAEFQLKQRLPYEAKIAYAEKRAWEFYDTITGRGDNCRIANEKRKG